MARKPRNVQNLKVSPEEHERLKRIGAQKGQPSRNPKGRPLEDEALKGHIREKLPELIDRLEEIAFDGKNESSAVKAIETMMSYVLSKATTKVEHDVGPAFGEFLSRVNKRRAEVIEADYSEVPPAIEHGREKDPAE